LTAERVDHVLREAAKYADIFPVVPVTFTSPRHPSDDHLFNLAVESKARFLVTWETRILGLASGDSSDADRLRALAPHLRIVAPLDFARSIRG
jgi:predicted nucleic acid-binding protein